MKARIVERNGKLFIETQLQSLGNQHTWCVLLKDDNKLNSVKDNIQKDWHSTLCPHAAVRRILEKLHLLTNK